MTIPQALAILDDLALELEADLSDEEYEALLMAIRALRRQVGA